MKTKFLTKLAKMKDLKAKNYHKSAGKLLIIVESVSQGIQLILSYWTVLLNLAGFSSKSYNDAVLCLDAKQVLK